MLRDAFDARPLFSRNSTARLGSDMSAEERADAEARIARRGETLVVQDIAPLGVAPVYRRRQVRRPAGFLARLRRLDADRLDGDAGRPDPRRRR